MYAFCGVLYFGLFNTFKYSPLPFTSQSSFLTFFTFLYLLSSHLWYVILLMLYQSLLLSLFP
jgi:hypothetical protein